MHLVLELYLDTLLNVRNFKHSNPKCYKLVTIAILHA